MKKAICYITLLIIMLSLTSCVLSGNGEQPDGNERDEFRVTFDPDGGEGAPEPITVKRGEKIPYQIPPSKRGYEFTHWSHNGEKWTLYKNTVSDDMTLVANYSLIKYSLSYDLNGGALFAPLKESYTVEDKDYLLKQVL